MTETAPPDVATLVAALERAAVLEEELPHAGLRFLDRRERERFLTWRQIRERACRVAGGLAALGVEPRQRVALIFPTGEEFFDAFFGALLAGAVPVPLYPPVRLGRLDEYHRRTARMVEAASAVVVLAEGRILGLLGETLAAARPPLGGRTVTFGGVAGLPAGQAPALAFTPEDLALVQFSSGTTVDPKPVALTHRAVMAQVQALNHFWPDRPEAPVHHSGVSWLPLYHDMGLIGCVFPALERPSVLTLIGPEVFVARPAVWLRALSRYRATISPAPNFAYGLCVERIRDEELEGVDLSSWFAALNGAEAVAPRVLRAFRERFARWGLRPEALTPVYGLSEAALAVTFAPLDEPFTTRRFDRQALAAESVAQPAEDGVELVSVGRPLPGFEVEVRAAGETPEEPLEEDRVGRLWVRGPSLMREYLDRPAATARALVDGWLDTGDLGFFHRGELFLTGRAKDLVILRGRNHPPDEIEHAVDAVAGVRTGCAVAASWLPENAEGERFVLFVEHHRLATEGEIEAMPEACRSTVAAATGLDPDEVVILAPGTLPRTSSGKLRRRETVTRHRAGTLVPPQPVNALRVAGAYLRSGRAWLRLGRSGEDGG